MAAVDVVPTIRVLAVDGQPHARDQLEHSLHDDHYVRLVHLEAKSVTGKLNYVLKQLF